MKGIYYVGCTMNDNSEENFEEYNCCFLLRCVAHGLNDQENNHLLWKITYWLSDFFTIILEFMYVNPI